MAKATRDAYGEEIQKLIKEDPRIVVMDADLAGSTRALKAKEVAPERFFDFGIAEQNLMDAAAGFAASGMIPFASTFAMFATGRCWEQIRSGIGYPGLNVKIVGSHSGITVGEDGATHQALEDIALMREIPGMSVFVPCDQYETKAAMHEMLKIDGPCYLRLGRAKTEDFYSADTDFNVMKVHVLRSGARVAIFATGIMVQSAMQAAKMLEQDGINATVVDVCTLDPADIQGIASILEDHEEIFTVEEHSIRGGLGSLICEVAAETCPRIVHRLGVSGYGTSGPADVLLHYFLLDGEGVYKQIKQYLG